MLLDIGVDRHMWKYMRSKRRRHIYNAWKNNKRLVLARKVCSEVKYIQSTHCLYHDWCPPSYIANTLPTHHYLYLPYSVTTSPDHTLQSATHALRRTPSSPTTPRPDHPLPSATHVLRRNPSPTTTPRPDYPLPSATHALRRTPSPTITPRPDHPLPSATHALRRTHSSPTTPRPDHTLPSATHVLRRNSSPSTTQKPDYSLPSATHATPSGSNLARSRSIFDIPQSMPPLTLPASILFGKPSKTRLLERQHRRDAKVRRTKQAKKEREQVTQMKKRLKTLYGISRHTTRQWTTAASK